MIEFFAADSGYYYIFLKNEKGKLWLDSCTLPDLEIRNWLSFFGTDEACNKQPAAFKQQAYLIYQKLLQSILENKTQAPVIIIPDNILWQLPWDALVALYTMLRNAKLQYLNDNIGGYASPYHWAAFVNTGYTPTNKTSNTSSWIIAAIAAALSIALSFTLLKKRF